MEKFTVTIDEDLKDIVPGFLSNRQKDITALSDFFEQKNVSEIEKIGHKVSGSSGGYGFEELGKIAKNIEQLAMNNDVEAIGPLIQKFREYVENVNIEYVNMD
ncbi:hypothetical protein A9Q84_11985 [Halobacteriovorax marinus]|uniref:HPt domain-containing protein n=1 Tax=Halobacteriovorax marinus TaxID=97084 RepID=A0A1Y5F8F7_9BACT|nr:hypothetical protein A9Q84_11985 [Halobacteriovorax marinus]